MFNSKDVFHQLKSEMTTDEAIEEYTKDCLAIMRFIIKTMYIFIAILSVSVLFLGERICAAWNTCRNLIINLLDYNNVYINQTEETWLKFQLKTLNLKVSNYGINLKNSLLEFTSKHIRNRKWL